MKIPRLKFVWGGSRVIQARWHLGLFGFYSRVEGKRDDGLAISGRGLLLWTLGLVVAAYVGGATALYFLWQRNPYSVLSYADAVFYPWRREAIAAKKGQAFIAEGTDLWRQKKYHEAATLLRQGLARYPQDFRARITLAQYYLLANRRPLALAVLQEGLTDDFPGRAYLQTLFDVAEQAEDFDLVVQLSQRYRSRVADGAGRRDRLWLDGRQFSALMAMERKTEALALALASGDGDPASERRVLALIALDRAAEAVAYLAEWRQRPGADARLVVRLQARALREAKQFEAMEAALVELRRLSPAVPAPAVYGVVQRVLAGRDDAARAAFDDYLFRFGGATSNLQMLAEPLAEIGELALLQRCAVAAAERGYPAAPYQTLLVQLYVQRGEWAEAARQLQRMSPAKGREAPAAQAWRDWMQRLLDAAITPGEGTQLAMVEFLRSRTWPVRIFRKSIEALRRAGRVETARDAAGIAIGAFPASAWLKTQTVEIEAALAAQQVAATAAMPAAVALRQWGEKPFWTRLNGLIEERKWSEADELVKALREARPRPVWLDARDADLRLAQVSVGHGLGRTLESLGAAKLYLNGDTARSAKLLDLARAWHAAGDKEGALALATEVRRKSPNYPPAQRLLAEWQKKSAK